MESERRQPRRNHAKRATGQNVPKTNNFKFAQHSPMYFIQMLMQCLGPGVLPRRVCNYYLGQDHGGPAGEPTIKLQHYDDKDAKKDTCCMKIGRHMQTGF